MSAPTTKPRHAKRATFFQRVGLPAIIILIGIAVLLYPVVSTQYNNYLQQKVAANYAEEMRNLPQQQLNPQIEAAREYNSQLKGGPILDPWLARISEDNAEYQHYLKQLSGAPAMSQMVIPSINLTLPVYHGTAEKTLQIGLGHMYGTALPLGGAGTHSVITGHTGITNATLFDNLEQVKLNDAVYLNTFGEKLKYVVDDIQVVEPEDTDGLQPIPGEDRLTLITCTPYGINTHRLLVHAHRVPWDDADQGVFEDKQSIMQWWMWLLMVLTALILAALVWWIRRERKREGLTTMDADESLVN
ncbi:class C sortase [Corynebacterium aquatimens]|uniref:Sortase A n=1 Tax=Corynebacterium aquatimens TaxID=1190508 RepID=A0A931GSD3_9CORY|nr:class C sortase [Corynebacterium aquatimens]MBG6122938.1 sortase A [Corynebacterium aquatimens]WJY66727.1 Sortase family protein [Corynebacterium aquatimens]